MIVGLIQLLPIANCSVGLIDNLSSNVIFFLLIVKPAFQKAFLKTFGYSFCGKDLWVLGTVKQTNKKNIFLIKHEV